MKKITFILHGKIRKLESLIADLKHVFSGDNNLQFYTTSYSQHSIELAKTAVKNGSTHIICVGGDGSLNEVVNGVMLAKENMGSFQDLRIGLIPAGTGNDFAKTIQMPADPVALKKCIDADHYLVIDLGTAEFTNPGGQSANRYFINISDMGIGGVVAQKLTTSSKWMGPNLTFQRAIISTLIGYKKQNINVQSDNFNYKGQIMTLVIANGKYFGSGMGIAPNALPDDGVLSIVIVGKISLLEYLRQLSDVKKCRVLQHPQIKYLSAREIYVESPDGPLPIDMDGEFVGYSPLKVKIVSRVLKFICPV